MYATPTFITEALHLVAKIQPLLMNYYSDTVAYAGLAHSCCVSYHNAFQF